MSSNALSLYRRLLRLHSKLPNDLRQIGIGYVRDEFKRHKNVTDQQMAQMFLREWQSFADILEDQLSKGHSMVGAKLGDGELDLLSDEQLVQLSELYTETKKVTE